MRGRVYACSIVPCAARGSKAAALTCARPCSPFRRATHAELERLSPHGTLREFQRAGHQAICSGVDIMGIEGIGGGKSLLCHLPAIADGVRAAGSGDRPAPLTVMVVPFIALGESQERAVNALVRWVKDRGQLPPDSKMCAHFVRCNSVVELVVGTDATSTTGMDEDGGWPSRLPCGLCAACRHDEFKECGLPTPAPRHMNGYRLLWASDMCC